jgi:hypothetical protein
VASVGHAPATLVGITRRLSLSTRIPRAVSPYARALAARDGAPPISGARSAGPGMNELLPRTTGAVRKKKVLFVILSVLKSY